VPAFKQAEDAAKIAELESQIAAIDRARAQFK
jgi:hypothetical protein